MQQFVLLSFRLYVWLKQNLHHLQNIWTSEMHSEPLPGWFCLWFGGFGLLSGKGGSQFCVLQFSPIVGSKYFCSLGFYFQVTQNLCILFWIFHVCDVLYSSADRHSFWAVALVQTYLVKRSLFTELLELLSVWFRYCWMIDMYYIPSEWAWQFLLCEKQHNEVWSRSFYENVLISKIIAVFKSLPSLFHHLP